MDDPNSAAVANAVAAGGNFWGRIQQMRQNNFQQQGIAIQQQNANTEQARAATGQAAENLAEDQFNQTTLPAAKTNLQLSQANLAETQKSQFLQSYNPLDSAKTSYGQQQAQQFLGSTSPVTDADAQADNKAQGLPTDNVKAAPGFIKMPMPQDPETRQALGVPAGLENEPQWHMPASDFQAALPALTQTLQTQSDQEFNKPYDEMNPQVQAAVRESYQKNSPPGVKVSDGEAAMAFRQQQRLTAPLMTPGAAGMVPTSAEFDPSNPSAMKISYQAKMGNPGDGGLTAQQYKDFGEPLQKTLSDNAELKSAQITAQNVANVVSYASDPHPSVSSDKSLIMSYLKSIDPTVRVSEGTVTTVMDGMGLPEEIKNSASKVMTGTVFTPDKREWFKNAAIQNLENARKTAADSIQSQLAISGATGNPLANNVKLPPSVLPPSQQSIAGNTSDSAAGGSDSQAPGEGVRKFNSLAQAEAARLPSGTRVLIFDPSKGVYRSATSQ